ncbi:hypothetical protein ACFCYB_32775 [Streptomyces sp. NPDC056309]|uniref:hypothetical protein n=1 Tax=unclassified Streptomyces TaxID=2593676 RepID=UPI0035DE289C
MKDVTLPAPGVEDQCSELLIHTATPEVGKQWQHIEDERLQPSGLLFQGETGGILAGSVVRRAWHGARKAVLLPSHVFESPTGRRVYDNRHTRLTKWLNDGIPPAQVADWAGNGVPVLLATYARGVEGQLPDLKRRLEAAGDLPELPDVG